MRINQIQNYKCMPNNNQNVNFGKLVVDEPLLSEIKQRVPESAYQELVKLMQKPINLKEALLYDQLPKGLKHVVDALCQQLPASEVEDYTIKIADIDQYTMSAGTYVDYDFCSEEDDCFDGLVDSNIIKLKLTAPNSSLLKNKDFVLFETEGKYNYLPDNEDFISNDLPIPSFEFITRCIQNEFRNFVEFLKSRQSENHNE